MIIRIPFLRGVHLSRPQQLVLGALITLLLFGKQLHSAFLNRPQPHPIPLLLHRAQSQYEATQLERSTTLEQACKRYQRTHNGRLPPKGFDEWFQFAQKIKACNVDTFEGMYKSLEVWWAVDPAEIRGRIEQLPGKSALGRVRVRGGKVQRVEAMEDAGIKWGSQSDARNGLEEMLIWLEERHDVVLPDVDFMTNGLDEPRVILPYERRLELERAAKKGDIVTMHSNEQITFFELKESTRLAYDIIRQSCPPTSLARRASLSASPGVSPLIQHRYTKLFTTALGSFLAAPSLERDTWCDQPDLQDLHATYIKPLSFAWTEQLAPVFSNSKLEGFGDILVPAWFYWYDQYLSYQEHDDPTWDEKANQIFWRGSNTGGASIGLNWMGWLRSRLVSRLNRPAEWGHEEDVLLANEANETVHSILPAAFLNRQLSDVAFAAPDQYGDADSLQSQLKEPSFRYSGRVPFKDSYGSKAILDLDGTAYSGRFVTLMKSRSAIFKARLYKEALDDSLVPWYHYVPVSFRLSEVYSLLGYFFGVTDVVYSLLDAGAPVTSKQRKVAKEGVAHDAELKDIADHGAAWGKACGRKEDQLLYAYLLALEWSRLCSDDRATRVFRMEQE